MTPETTTGLANDIVTLGAGVIDAAAVEKGWIQLDERTQPRPEAHAKYARGFQQYCNLYPALKETMHGLHDA